jgi:hypothetical protein
MRHASRVSDQLRQPASPHGAQTMRPSVEGNGDDRKDERHDTQNNARLRGRGPGREPRPAGASSAARVARLHGRERARFVQVTARMRRNNAAIMTAEWDWDEFDLMRAGYARFVERATAEQASCEARAREKLFDLELALWISEGRQPTEEERYAAFESSYLERDRKLEAIRQEEARLFADEYRTLKQAAESAPHKGRPAISPAPDEQECCGQKTELVARRERTQGSHWLVTELHRCSVCSDYLWWWDGSFEHLGAASAMIHSAKLAAAQHELLHEANLPTDLKARFKSKRRPKQ